MNIYTIITAGGLGIRMGSGIPKQFLPVNGKPLLMHTFDRFLEYNPAIRFILSLPEEFIPYWKELCVEFSFSTRHEIVSGGQTRFHSVKNALEKVTDSGFVAIHDGVRPLVSLDTLIHAFNTAEAFGNAVASRAIPFSLRMKNENGNQSVNRKMYYEIQTPQIFKSELLKKAYDQAYSELFTDDASVVESIGEKIRLCEGNPENIKITTRIDLLMAELLLKQISTRLP